MLLTIVDPVVSGFIRYLDPSVRPCKLLIECSDNQCVLTFDCIVDISQFVVPDGYAIKQKDNVYIVNII